MNSNWWWNRQWVIRDNGPLARLFDPDDTLVLEPNTADDIPLFFWIRFDNKDPKKSACWKDRYVYAVGVTPPATSLVYSWDDTKPCDKQAPGVREHYNGMVNRVRSTAENPFTARLEGHIPVDSHWEIIRFFCFQGAQPNGRDWITVDALQKNPAPGVHDISNPKLLEDGTGHGDPPH
jgi:hypothetical protein